ncbi:hypothetical protein Ciccas_001101 [Cichlidogyrus casuarinus]|uniref:PI4-kinase N-terminal domain-containing protein n=1 Tax=Cichlidogyrus casuarinus TaxID=1844966 RepID=A0ABD2QKZ3_9PLAT
METRRGSTLPTDLITNGSIHQNSIHVVSHCSSLDVAQINPNGPIFCQPIDETLDDETFEECKSMDDTTNHNGMDDSGLPDQKRSLLRDKGIRFGEILAQTGRKMISGAEKLQHQAAANFGALTNDDNIPSIIAPDYFAQCFIFEILTDSIATCLQILTKTVTESNEAESLLNRLMERIHDGVENHNFSGASLMPLTRKPPRFTQFSHGFSSNTFLAIFFRDTNLMYFNTVLTLGFIGVELCNLPRTQDLVLQFFRQSLQNVSVELGQETIDKLAAMVCGRYDGTVSPFPHPISYPSLEGFELRSRREVLGRSVANAFANMATCVQGHERLLELLQMLMQHYIHLDMETKQLFKQGNLILNRLPTIKKPGQKIEKLFRDFWFYCVTLSYNPQAATLEWPKEWYSNLCLIAPKSPTLLFSEPIKSELDHNPALNSRNLSVTDQTIIKTQLCTMFGNDATVTPFINKMNITQCAYLIAVYQVESLYIENSSDPEGLARLFDYLEDPIITKDKFGMLNCMQKVIELVFDKFLRRVVSMPMNWETEAYIDLYAQYLLVKFNHTQSISRITADSFLSQLASVYPNVFWSGRVLFTMLDITQLLSESLKVDSNQAAPIYPVPDTPFKLITMDNLSDREVYLKDFLKICERVLEEGLKWAPNMVRSHLAEYVLRNERNSIGSYQHRGLALATETLLNYAGYNSSSSGSMTPGVNPSMGTVSPTMVASERVQPSGAKLDCFNFMSNLNLRNQYHGEVGVLSLVSSSRYPEC